MHSLCSMSAPRLRVNHAGDCAAAPCPGEHYSCWLSKAITSAPDGCRFERILCFEPMKGSQPPERVGDIFRSLTLMLIVRPEIHRRAPGRYRASPHSWLLLA